MSLTLGTASSTNFNPSNEGQTASIIPISASAYVIVYIKGNGYGVEAVYCSVSGTNVSVGTPVVIAGTGEDSRALSAVKLSSSSIAVFWTYINGTVGYSCILSISGTTITKNTTYTYDNSYGTVLASACALSSTKALLMYYSGSNSGTAKVVTISGTSMSFGSATAFASGDFRGDYSSLASVSDTKAVFLFTKYSSGTSFYTQSIVATVSDTSVSFGSTQAVDTGRCDTPKSIKKISSTEVVCIYSNRTNNYVRLGTVGTSTVSWGSAKTVSSYYGDYNIDVTPVSDSQLATIYTGEYSSNYPGIISLGSISGSSITFSNDTTYSTNIGKYGYVELLTTGKAIILYSGYTRIATIPSPFPDMKINIGDTWKTVTDIQINIGDTWKTADMTGSQLNIGDTWKDLST